MKHWLLLVLLGALLAACGDGDGEPEVSGGGNIGWVDIDEPINGNGIYTTRASSIEIGGNGLPAKTPTLSFYDPATDSWRATSNQCEPYLSAGDFYAHWTGSRLFAWSNADAGGYFYDPASDNWQSIESRGGPPTRGDAASVWTGDRFILWGGQEISGLRDAGFVFREWRPLLQFQRHDDDAGVVG